MSPFFFFIYIAGSQDVIKIQAKENMDLSKLLSDIAAKKAWGVKLADYLSSTAKLKYFVNLHFVSEVRQEVVRDISKSVLSKSDAQVTCRYEKNFGTEMCIKFENEEISITGLAARVIQGRSRKRYGRLRYVLGCSRLRDSWVRWIEKVQIRKYNERNLGRAGAAEGLSPLLFPFSRLANFSRVFYFRFFPTI